jgi:hypothetical protein
MALDTLEDTPLNAEQPQEVRPRFTIAVMPNGRHVCGCGSSWYGIRLRGMNRPFYESGRCPDRDAHDLTWKSLRDARRRQRYAR